MKKKVISIFLAIAMIATLFASLTACGTSTVDLNKYMDIKVTGYNGYGVASRDPKEDEFLKDFKNVKLTKAGKEEYPQVTDDGTAEFLYTLIFYNGSFTTSNGSYSNGDEVTYSWKCDDDLIEDVKNAFNVNVEFSDITLTVSGLEDPPTFDAFEGVSVTFDGTEPNGSATITADGLLPDSEFTIEPTSGLSNGDTVTVSLLIPDIPGYFIDEYGAVPVETTREYTVEGLAGYVNTLSQIPEDGLNKMDAQARDSMYARAADMFNSEYQDISSINLLGCYLLTPKEGFNTRTENEIYLVYQVDCALHNKDANGNIYDTSFSFYRYYEFKNGMILPDGTFSIDYSDYDIPNAEVDATAYDKTERYEWNEDKTLRYSGYDNLDTLFNNVVTQNIEDFNYESSVGAENN